MARRAPGKHYRKGLTIIDAVGLFADDETAEQWFVEQRWPDGIHCPACNATDIQHRRTRKPQPYRCNACRKDFSVKTGSIMHGSKLPLKTWGMAMYLLATGLKGTSSLKLHRDLGITQKSAWHLAHRIRKTWEADASPFVGPVEADESHFGGLEKNKPEHRKLHAGRGTVGKVAVAGVKDRTTNRISAAVVPDTTGATLQGFVRERTQPDAMVYTDDATAYQGLPHHASVTHSVGQWVDGLAHTNGLESFWSMMKRGYHGTYHKMSPKHLDRYVGEFEGRHNQRPADTLDQMRRMVRGMDGKRLTYGALTQANGLPSGARRV